MPWRTALVMMIMVGASIVSGFMNPAFQRVKDDGKKNVILQSVNATVLVSDPPLIRKGWRVIATAFVGRRD